MDNTLPIMKPSKILKDTLALVEHIESAPTNDLQEAAQKFDDLGNKDIKIQVFTMWMQSLIIQELERRHQNNYMELVEKVARPHVRNHFPG